MLKNPSVTPVTSSDPWWPQMTLEQTDYCVNEFWANFKVFIPVHLILLDAVDKSQSLYVHEDPKPKQKKN